MVSPRQTIAFGSDLRAAEETKFGQIQVWPSLVTMFGQTKFGQDQVWPNQVWPNRSLAKFGQNILEGHNVPHQKILNFEGKLGKEQNMNNKYRRKISLPQGKKHKIAK